MKKIAVLWLALSSPAFAQSSVDMGEYSGQPFFTATNNSTIINSVTDSCIVASVSTKGEVEVNYKCAERYSKLWNQNKFNDMAIMFSIILNAIHNGTAKTKE